MKHICMYLCDFAGVIVVVVVTVTTACVCKFINKKCVFCLWLVVVVVVAVVAVALVASIICACDIEEQLKRGPKGLKRGINERVERLTQHD